MELFGIPPATLSRVMVNAAAALRLALYDLPDAVIQFPSHETQIEWATKTEEREPLIKGIWGFIDGKNYRIQEPSNKEKQNAFYNGKCIALFCGNFF